MAVVRKKPGFHVDGRVSIALDALSDEQKQLVGGVITDRGSFLASASDRRKVQRLSKDEPLYALKAPAGLRIVFSQVDDEIVVIDLMNQATLDQYGRKPAKLRGASGKKLLNGAAR